MNPVTKHIKKLNQVFQCNPTLDEDGLEDLYRIETHLHKLFEDYCNGNVSDETINDEVQNALVSIHRILGYKVPISINSDPRGYALKISDEVMRKHKFDLFTDMGGNGIICPEF